MATVGVRGPLESWILVTNLHYCGAMSVLVSGQTALGIGLDPEHVELEFNEIVKYKSRLTKGGNIDTEVSSRHV